MALAEDSELIQSSGGVFEIDRKGQLLFSKKKENRFPEDGEVVKIIKLLNDGSPLTTAQEEAAKDAKKPPSFGEWLVGKILPKHR